MFAIRFVFVDESRWDAIQGRMFRLIDELPGTKVLMYKTAKQEVQVVVQVRPERWTSFVDSQAREALQKDLNDLRLTTSEMGFNAILLVG